MVNFPQLKDIEKAAARIKSQAIKTPLIENGILNEIVGARVFIKAENLQKTGSFKFRGAFNAISALDENERKNGVVACSSGNHAQGIAEAARLLGVNATIVMPSDSPQIKMERTKRSGAKVITYDRITQDREKIALDFCEKHNAVYLHPFENFHVISGQGTVGLEISQQMRDLDLTPDRMLVCTGGGGLTAGCAIAMSHEYPQITINSVEPEEFDDYKRSLEAGEIVGNCSKSGSICDALLTDKPGALGFEVNKQLLSDGLTVSDNQVVEAIKFAFFELKLAVEPGGAVTIAALLNSNKKWSGENIACTISGGNIDPKMMASAITG